LRGCRAGKAHPARCARPCHERCPPAPGLAVEGLRGAHRDERTAGGADAAGFALGDPSIATGAPLCRTRLRLSLCVCGAGEQTLPTTCAACPPLESEGHAPDAGARVRAYQTPGKRHGLPPADPLRRGGRAEASRWLDVEGCALTVLGLASPDSPTSNRRTWFPTVFGASQLPWTETWLGQFHQSGRLQLRGQEARSRGRRR